MKGAALAVLAGLAVAGIALALPQQPMQTMGAASGSSSGSTYDGGSTPNIGTVAIDAGRLTLSGAGGGTLRVGHATATTQPIDLRGSYAGDLIRVQNNDSTGFSSFIAHDNGGTAKLGFGYANASASDPNYAGSGYVVGATSTPLKFFLNASGTPAVVFLGDGTGIVVTGTIDAGTVVAKEMRWVNADGGNLSLSGDLTAAGVVTFDSTSIVLNPTSNRVGFGFDPGSSTVSSAGRAKVTVRAEGTSTNYAFLVEDSSQADGFAVLDNGDVKLKVTDNTVSTGNFTANTTSFKGKFAASGTAITVTNSLVSSTSNVVCSVQTSDSTLKSVVADPGSGSVVITGNAAATAATEFGCTVFN